MADSLARSLSALRRSTSTLKIVIYVCSALGTFLLLLSQLRTQHLRQLPASFRQPVVESESRFSYEDGGEFVAVPLIGFDNTHKPGNRNVKNLTCSMLEHSAQIGVQKSFLISDDKSGIAYDLDRHPMVDYSLNMLDKDEKDFKLSRLIEHSWERLANACVLLRAQNVYLCVTRVIFLDSGRRDKARISFLRGQIFDKTWTQIDGYVLKWKNEEIVFPRVFDIESEYDIGGHVFGPEDPRILIEEDVPDAEPVIVFNMLMKPDSKTWTRAMWIFRPFSGNSTVLTLREEKKRRLKEKNWTPMFIRDQHTVSSGTKHDESTHIHFVYSLEPLKVLKCSLQDGMCDTIFQQKFSEDLLSPHSRNWTFLRGGTQFIPVPMSKLLGNKVTTQANKGVQAYVSLARTHAEKTSKCNKAVYRPEIVVLVTNGTSFYLTYGSGPIDFGAGAVMDAKALLDPCGSGRIMIPNGIADWDLDAMLGDYRTDIMTLTVSVDDATTQVIRISGIMSLLSRLPSLKLLASDQQHQAAIFEPESQSTATTIEDDPYELLTNYSAVGWDVRACVEEAARHSLGG